MKRPLLSIIVPTKDRYLYLTKITELILSFENDDIELVIEDNSTDNAPFLEWLSSVESSHIVYHYEPHPMPVIDNSCHAIMHSKGKYICFMGDDDLLSPYLYDFALYMEKKKIEAAVFNKAFYSWPGVKFKAHNFPNLVIPNFHGGIFSLDHKNELNKGLERGFVDLGKLPQLYHGIVLRDCLEKVYSATGTYFPGPSPDMAVAIPLAYFISNYVFCDVPLVSSGKSPKSAAGLGAKHNHKGKLKEISFLPADIEEKWDIRLPRIWTGPTIYAQSAFEAIKSLGKPEEIARFNFSYFYAFFYVFCKEYRDLLKQTMERNSCYSTPRFYAYVFRITLKRIHIFLLNKAKILFHYSVRMYKNISDTVEAQKIIDSAIEKSGFFSMINTNL